MSGDILSFEIYEGYKVRNLRKEFYLRMVEELSIKDIECITIFDNNYEKASLDDFITEGKIYRIFVNNMIISIFYDSSIVKITFKHEYETFPSKAVILITDSVKKNKQHIYRYLYNELVKGFQDDIDFFNDNPDNYRYLYNDNILPTFDDYSQNKYGGEPEFEDIVKEYISLFISKRFQTEEFVYE